MKAIACSFPPTDFLNYGKPGENAIARGILRNASGVFDFGSWPTTGESPRQLPTTREAPRGRRIFPVKQLNADAQTTLIIYNGKD
ncbi:hypothetical protein ACXR0O_23365 [Verrucomicrobiota bacterium sgz303538]